MESQNILGIYLSVDSATVVCLDSRGSRAGVLDCFSVSVESDSQQDRSSWDELVGLIGQQCSQRKLAFSDVAVALDCTIFMQHDVHSSFDSAKQIAATVRFDTEEALATDVSDVAIGFEVMTSGEEGSELGVFTAQKKVLSEIIAAFAGGNLDPVSIEPDVICLSRFARARLSASSEQSDESLFAMLSRRNGYFITAGSRRFERTFLTGAEQDRTDLLAGQVPVTTALFGVGEQINRLEVLDSSDSIDVSKLQQSLGTTTELVDSARLGLSQQQLDDCADVVEFAIAYGAAVGEAGKEQTTNFRSDYMPYLGKKRRLEKTLKFVSVSAVVILVALGLNLQMQLIQKNKPVRQLRKNLAEDYSAVMMGKEIPGNTREAVRKLGSELRRIKSIKSGQLSGTGEGGIPAKLAVVLEAFNDSAKQTDLNIDKVSVTAKHITIKGDTSSRSNTLKLLKDIKSRMTVQQERLGSKDNRDTFSITAVPKRRGRR